MTSIRSRCKRVFFISQVYAPSHDAISQMNADLAVGLRDRGWDVHVLTNQVNYMSGERLPRHERIDGVRVWRTSSLPLKRTNPLARMAMYGGFLLISGPASALMPAPDVAVYLSTPPLVAWSAAAMRRFGKAKLVYWAQDVYPEVPIQMGYLKNPLLKRLLFSVERRVVRDMDNVVVIGDEMGRVFVKKGVPAEKVSTIPNWSIVSFENRIPRDKNPLLAENGLSRKFVVQYSGNMGIVHDMAPLCEAMAKTRDDGDIHWLMIGEGKRRREIERVVEGNGLHHVTLLPYQPMETLDVSLSAADVSIISLRPEMEGLVVPSKLFSSMAAGLPIAFIGSRTGEVAGILQRHGCGRTVATGDELIEFVKELRQNPSLCRSMGENARQAYVENFSREKAIDKFHDLLSETTEECAF